MKNTIAFLLLLVSIQANAILITERGFTLDTETNIVTDGVLEWLQWDELIGRGVADVLSDPFYDGWEIASTEQVADLFNTFFDLDPLRDGESTWPSVEDTLQTRFRDYGEGDEDVVDFLSLFGSRPYCVDSSADEFDCEGDPLLQIQVFFGEDTNNDNYINQAYVGSAWRYRNITRGGPLETKGTQVVWEGPEDDIFFVWPDRSVALVRRADVPEPPTFLLLGLAVIGLLAIRRRGEKQRRSVKYGISGYLSWHPVSL